MLIENLSKFNFGCPASVISSVLTTDACQNEQQEHKFNWRGFLCCFDKYTWNETRPFLL